MKKLIVLLTSALVFTLAGCAEDATYDKEANPESGVVVFVGYDKKEYFIVESDSSIYGDTGSGYIELDFGNGEEFNTNDVYYKYVFKDKASLNATLKKYGHEEIK